jgi:hypothetical protein
MYALSIDGAIDPCYPLALPKLITAGTGANPHRFLTQLNATALAGVRTSKRLLDIAPPGIGGQQRSGCPLIP